MKIQNNHLSFRRFSETDFQNMRDLESDADIMKFTPSRIPQTPEQTQTKLSALISKPTPNDLFGVWALEFKNSQEFIGWYMIMKTDLPFPEIGFMILKKH